MNNREKLKQFSPLQTSKRNKIRLHIKKPLSLYQFDSNFIKKITYDYKPKNNAKRLKRPSTSAGPAKPKFNKKMGFTNILLNKNIKLQQPYENNRKYLPKKLNQAQLHKRSFSCVGESSPVNVKSGLIIYGSNYSLKL